MELIFNNSYDEGIVSFIDILGFSNVVKTEESFNDMKKVFTNILSFQNATNLTNIIKTSIFSDSILLSLKIERNEIESSIGYFFERINRIRKIIIKHMNTDIRVGICYGKYIHIPKICVYYGPAIICAHDLAENSDKICKEYGCLFENRPAAILIDKNSFITKSNKGEDNIYNTCIEPILKYSDLFSNEAKLNNCKYSIFNPYKYSFNPYGLSNADDCVAKSIEFYANHLLRQSEMHKSKYLLDTKEFIQAIKEYDTS